MHKRARCSFFTLFFGVLGLGLFLPAQDKSQYPSHLYPDDPSWSTDWVAFYRLADEMTAQARRRFPHHLDLSYGPHPKQKLDLYLPETRSADAAVFLFLHGGGFREGDRAHFGFIAEPYAANGIITAVASYQLLPDAHYPTQSEDIQKALAWLYRNVQEYGGSPQRIFVGGHSAGAYIAADVMVKNEWTKKHSVPSDLIKGAVLVSGVYDMRSFSRWSYVPEAGQRSAASPVLQVASGAPPTIVAVGTLEPDYIAGGYEFVRVLQQHDARVEFLILPRMQHHDTVLAVGDKYSSISKAILKLINSTVGH